MQARTDPKIQGGNTKTGKLSEQGSLGNIIATYDYTDYYTALILLFVTCPVSTLSVLSEAPFATRIPDLCWEIGLNQ